ELLEDDLARGDRRRILRFPVHDRLAEETFLEDRPLRTVPANLVEDAALVIDTAIAVCGEDDQPALACDLDALSGPRHDIVLARVAGEYRVADEHARRLDADHLARFLAGRGNLQVLVADADGQALLRDGQVHRPQHALSDEAAIFDEAPVVVEVQPGEAE